MNRILSNPLANLSAAALLIASLTLASVPKVFAAEDVVIATTAESFDKTVTNLKRAITKHKLVIVKEVPFQQMLAMVGVKSEKVMGFEIFHPRYGKVLYEKDPAAFMDAPLRILVTATGDEVSLQYRKPSVVFAPYSGLADLGKELDEIFADIVSRVAK